MFSTLILAASFFDSSLGQMFTSITRALAVLVVALGAIKAVSAVQQGKVPQALKTFFGAVFLSVFLFQPAMIEKVIETMSTITEKVLSGSEEIVNDSNQPTGPNAGADR